MQTNLNIFLPRRPSLGTHLPFGPRGSFYARRCDAMKCPVCKKYLPDREYATYGRHEDHYADVQPSFGSCLDYLIDDPQLLTRVEEPPLLEVA